jgi:hypothetical protein
MADKSERKHSGANKITPFKGNTGRKVKWYINHHAEGTIE